MLNNGKKQKQGKRLIDHLSDPQKVAKIPPLDQIAKKTSCKVLN
jgi:hypothetical protein